MLNGSNLHVYILPWCIGDVNSRQLIPKMHTPQNAHTQKLINDAFFAYHANSTIPAKRICNNLDIATKQQKDKTLAKIVHALQSSHPDGAQIDSNGHRANCSRENSINLSLSQEPRLNDKKPQTFLKAGHTIQILSKISIPST